MTTLDKLTAYAVNFWKKHNLEKWPSVRELSRGTGISQKTIAEHVDDYGPLSTEFYNTKHSFGERFVTVSNDDVEATWGAHYA